MIFLIKCGLKINLTLDPDHTAQESLLILYKLENLQIQALPRTQAAPNNKRKNIFKSILLSPIHLCPHFYIFPHSLSVITERGSWL